MSSTTSKTVAACSRSRKDLKEYQRRAVAFMHANPSCGLWAEMGTGKTAVTITALADLFERFDIGRTLVVAPLRVARTTWPDELRLWDQARELSFAVIKGSPEKRLSILRDDRSDMHIINVELLLWLVDAIKNEPALKNTFGGRWPYDVVVLDESSLFGDTASKRFKAMRKQLPHIDRVWQLTGTPAGNGLVGLWSQTFLLDRGERLGRTKTSYLRRWFDAGYMGYTYTPKEGAQAEIEAALSDICMSLLADDHLDLPAMVPNDVVVELPTKARRFYRELEREFVAQLDSGETAEALTAAALTNKLLQCANGAIYSGEAGEWSELHTAKLDALQEIVTATEGKPLLVAYNFKFDLARIKKRFPQARVLDKDPATIAAWNAGKIAMLLTHPASAAHGLNLQYGGNHLVWYGLNWSLELYLQFNARLRRQGQKFRVFNHRIIANNTADQAVVAALTRKNVTQRGLLEALRGDAERRLAA